MIAEPIRRSPLAGYSDRFASLSQLSGGRLTLREIPFLTQVNLRADPTDSPTMKSIAEMLDLELPLRPNTVASTANRSALWLGPDEWLLVAPADQAATPPAFAKMLGGSISLVDVSANRTVIRLEGTAAHELLAFGCAVDLHPRSFGPGRCIQTMLAKAQVIIESMPTVETFQLYVRASFATYLAEWLIDAMPGLNLPAR